MNKPEMTVHLKPDDIKEAIRLYVQRELNMFTSYDDITINVELEFNDRQPGDRGTPRLIGADAKVRPKTD